MARFKDCNTAFKLLPVDFAAQIQPGTFEHTLCHLVDHELDLSALNARFANDTGGAPAYPPAVQLKIVLLAYSRGMISSRRIARACRENVLFMAVSGDLAPHFTTIADFVSSLGDDIAPLFARVLLVCDRLNLIGRDLFAIDGVKLPGNASKAKSGTRTELKERADKMRAAAERIIARHREQDAAKAGDGLSEREIRSIERLQKQARQVDEWLSANPKDRKGTSGGVRKSNLTDNDSAKMATGKGVIQGYTGVAAVDAAHQIIMEAQAHGTGSEQELLIPMAESLTPLSAPHTCYVADAGYHSTGNVETLEQQQRPAYICDNQYRLRDPRYADQDKHRNKPDPLHDKSASYPGKCKLFRPADFQLAEDGSHCVCPAGNRLYRNGGDCTINDQRAMKFSGAQRDCLACTLRAQCLRKPDTTKVRQVAFFRGRRDATETAVDRMKARIDSDIGKQMIAARFATVEPVFGNLRANKQLTRFTLRGQKKVDGQWKLMCMLHNIEKLAHHGYAQ
ncbi:transposase, IS4 family [Formivibrio citricus]|uniref:Transposase, IS4 family n=1 Tax=Formivibrio citricus TaxID=83765 RepID=A0A1I5DJJ6_9NEIS|nr:transposase [Formivibrio citricus]SFN99419.1 transposase, IS4 family [Formivibrio citricus]